MNSKSHGTKFPSVDGIGLVGTACANSNEMSFCNPGVLSNGDNHNASASTAGETSKMIGTACVS